MTEEELGRRRLARWVWLAGFVVAAVILFIAYLRMSRTYPATSDGADQALQAWDMLHGNLLLHGWTIADVTYSTTEVPQYMLIELVLGNFGRGVHHVRDGPAVQQQVAVQHVPGLQGLVRAVRGSGIGPREPEETEEQGD